MRFLGSTSKSENLRYAHFSSKNFDISDEDVQFLLNSGQTAVRDFIQNEHSKLSASLASDVASYSEDEFFDDLVREMMIPGQRLIVSCVNTAWYWRLFPSIAHWMFAGADVDILVNSKSSSPREAQRRKLLQMMGAKVVEIQQIPVKCFVLSRKDDRHNAAFTQDISATKHSPFGVTYIGTKHRPIIDILITDLDRLLGSAKIKRPELTLKESSGVDELELMLKEGVHQYSDPNVTIELTEVSLKPDADKPVEMIVRRVRSLKYRQIAHLASLYEKFSISFCVPADIIGNGKHISTITPPVFEEWGNKLVAIEGNTRIYYLRKIGIDSIHCFVVKGVSAPLPGRPIDPREALLSTYHLPSEERIKEFSYENFRSIEGAVRPTE